MSGYVPLWCKSHYSFLEGASSPEEYVDACRRLGVHAFALTDRDGLYGVVRAHQRAVDVGVQLIIGAEVTLDDGSHIVLLVRDQRGYQQLCTLLSIGRLRSAKGSSSVSWGELCQHADGLVALWGGRNSALIRPGLRDTQVEEAREAFGEHLFAQISRHRLELDRAHEQQTRAYAERFGLPLVGTTEVLYHSPLRRDLQDVMTCIRRRCTLSTAGNLTRPNAEHALKNSRAFQQLFADAIPLMEATRTIAERCTFSLSELRYVYPAEGAPEGMSPDQWLRQLTFEGAEKRYGHRVPSDVTQQLERELQLIQELDYGGYFLTMKELVDYCEANEILCQGRGSAANSAVCYCLGITAVDPVRMDLLFERFLSKERAEPPDIDLDIAHQRREEVIQHMYNRYGRDRAAMVANMIRYRPRSAIRDVGAALGLGETTLNRVAKQLSHRHDISSDVLEAAGLSMELPVHQHLLRLSNELLDAPRHLSIHPGGFIIGNGPVHHLVPIENGSMENRTVIQWDKYDIEAMGLFKVDLLGLGALTQIDHCLRLIKDHYQQHHTLATIPPDCPETFKMITEGKTIGVFQIESRAQMSMAPRLKPRCFYDIVIQISLVRPGPITGGMIHPYLRRRSGEEPVDYPHPSLKPILERTLGIPLFQEQVMRLAVVAADYTPGEADQLRRDMAAWRSEGRIEQHRERLIRRMMHKGIAQEFAERVFEQIRGFGEYGFPESHAASFSLLAWATSWLRRHFPEAFTASLLNAQPMGFYSVDTILQDARRNGLKIRPIDVQQSDWLTTLEDCPDTAAKRHSDFLPPRHQSALRLGLRHLQAFREEDAQRILQARADAPFRSLDDLLQRTQLREEAALKLAQAGALESLGLTRRDAIWAIRRLCRATTLPLFEEESNDQPETAFAPLSAVETLHWDHRLTRTSTQGHLLEPFRAQLNAQRLPLAEALNQSTDGRYVRYAGVVIVRQRPSTAAGVVFLTLEDESGFVNVIIWPKVWERYAQFVRSHSFLGVSGRLQRQHGVTHIIADHFWPPKTQAAPPTAKSYDFH